MSSGVELIVFPIAVLTRMAFTSVNKAASGAAERQQRRIEARAWAERALADHDLLRSRIDAARGRYGEAITAMPPVDRRELSSTDEARAEAARARLAVLVRDAANRLRLELAAAGTAELVAGLRTGLASVTAPATAPTGPPAAPDPASPAETVRRVLERLDATVPAATRETLETRAAAVLTAGPGRVSALADDLRDGVRQANDSVAHRRARLAELHARLERNARYAALAGPAAEAMEEVRRALIATGDDPDPDWPALSAEVDDSINHALAAVLRDYAAGAVRDAFEEVGCEVEEGFDVLLVEQGAAHLRRPEWTDLAVRVRQDDVQGGQSLRLTLVAPEDSAAEIDAATEKKWCGTVDELLPALAARDLGVEVVERTAPGAGYVQPVSQTRFPFGDAEETDERSAGRRRPVEPRQRRAPRQ
jgi:hypothetical protein